MYQQVKMLEKWFLDEVEIERLTELTQKYKIKTKDLFWIKLLEAYSKNNNHLIKLAKVTSFVSKKKEKRSTIPEVITVDYSNNSD